MGFLRALPMQFAYFARGSHPLRLMLRFANLKIRYKLLL